MGHSVPSGVVSSNCNSTAEDLNIRKTQCTSEPTVSEQKGQLGDAVRGVPVADYIECSLFSDSARL